MHYEEHLKIMREDYSK